MLSEGERLYLGLSMLTAAEEGVDDLDSRWHEVLQDHVDRREINRQNALRRWEHCTEDERAAHARMMAERRWRKRPKKRE